MTRALTLSLVLAIAPVSLLDDPSSSAQATSCAERIPTTIRVHRIHRKGSSRPARVDEVPTRTYVERVMASGAWPAWKPMESLKAGAVVILARAWWHVCHPQPGYVRDGQRYDIHDGSPRRALRGRADGGQLYRDGVVVHSRIRRAVSEVFGVALRRGHRQVKPRWSGDGSYCAHRRTGNALPEGSATACARKGWSWRRIIRTHFPRVELVR